MQISSYGQHEVLQIYDQHTERSRTRCLFQFPGFHRSIPKKTLIIIILKMLQEQLQVRNQNYPNFEFLKNRSTSEQAEHRKNVAHFAEIHCNR